MNALTQHHLLSDTSLSSTAHPDAELIAICDAHQAKIDAVNTSGDIDGGPADQAYVASQRAISAARPITMDGVRAIARAAKAEARNLDGSEGVGCTPAEYWSMNIINHLVDGLGGESPAGADDTEVLRMATQHLNAWQTLEDCPRDIESVDDPLYAPYAEALRFLATARPQTMVGFRAVAGCIQTEVRGQLRRGRKINGDLAAGEVSDNTVRLMWSLITALLGSSAPAPMDPDAELLRLCAQHQAAYRTVNAFSDETDRDCQEAPDWPLYNQALDALQEVRVTTLAGCRAMAASILREAQDPDGSIDIQQSTAADLTLALVQALLATPPAAPPPSPDAALHATLAEFDHLQRQINVTWADGPGRIEDDEARDAHNAALEKQQAPLVALIQQTPARTAEGVLAKLRSAWLAQPDFILEGPGCPGERLATSAAHDALATAPGYWLSGTGDAV